MTLALSILILVLAVVLIALVLMQSGKGKNLSGTIAGGSDTYFSKGKSTTKDKILFRITAVLSVVFVICVLVLYLIAK